MGEDIVLLPQGLREGCAKVRAKVLDGARRARHFAAESIQADSSGISLDMTRKRMFYKVHPHAASHDYLHFSGRFRSFLGPRWSTMKARTKHWTAGFVYSHGAPLSELTKKSHFGTPWSRFSAGPLHRHKPHRTPPRAHRRYSRVITSTENCWTCRAVS